MYGLVITRCAFTRLNPEIFQKVTTYSTNASNLLVSTEKYYQEETSRSSCAAFSSTVPTTSINTDDVTKMRSVFAKVVEESTPNANQVYPVLLRKFNNCGMKSTWLLGRDTINAQVQPARLAREYSTRKLLPVQNIYRSGSAPFSTEVLKVMVANNQLTDFMSIFPEIVQDINQDVQEADQPDEPNRISKMLEYNLIGGKQNGPRTLLETYKAFADPEELTIENLRKAQILAWCCQLGFTSMIMLDDIMDNSEMRRGKPCWYRQKEIGMIGINDALIVECAGLLLLRRHFRQHPRYVSLVEAYQTFKINTARGQNLDLLCRRDGKSQLDQFTNARYDLITKHKASFPLYLPVEFATILAGVDSQTEITVRKLMMKIGRWFQEQDDVLDYTGTTNMTGKDIALDIQDGKCTWLVVTALERASPEQRAVMERCYGSPDPKHIQAIRDVYDQLDLTQLYAVREEELLSRLRTQIDRDFSGKPQEMFHRLIDTLHNRIC